MTQLSNPEQSTSISKTRRTDAAGRAARALELRLAGLGYAEIAVRLGFADKSGAWRSIEGELRSVRRERANEVIDLDLMRLDKLLAAVWSRALEGDLSAIDRVLKILERRARYFNLDGRAESTSDQLLVVQELSYADDLARLAEIRNTIDARMVAAVYSEVSRMSHGLPVADSPWEDAAVRLEAFSKEGEERGGPS